MRGYVSSVYKLGVVSTMRRPIALNTWLTHHRKFVTHFFLYATDGDEIPHAADITVVYRPDQPYAYEFWERQEEHVNHCIEVARKRRITHLIHIDDDELVHLPNGIFALLCELQYARDAGCLVMKNWEARLHAPVDVSDLFAECHFFTQTKHHAYANGKSIGNLTANVKGSGAHRFRSLSKAREVVLCNAVVLHFEGIVKRRYHAKMRRYRERAGRTQCEMGTIPFKSYCRAINASDDSEMNRVWESSHVAKLGDTLVCVHLHHPASICLVGNGPSAVNKGHLIDACDTVVRFNLFDTTQGNVGSRTDVWCLSDHVCRTSSVWKDHPRPLIIVGNSRHADSNVPPVESATVYDSRNEFGVLNQDWYSTGFLALHYMLTSYPDSVVFLVGFDHFTSTLHYFEDRKLQPHHHNGANEKDRVDDMIASTGRVVRI